MKTRFHKAGVLAVVATMITTLANAEGSGAWARENAPVAYHLDLVTEANAPPIVEPLAPEAAMPPIQPAETKAAPPSSLAQLVAQQAEPGELSHELECLASAVYFEAKSESLAGQLAVGRVVVARAKSGRFPNSYCGVVFQPSQFSFVRGHAMPGIVRSSRFWRDAVAIAQIAHAGSWRSPVEGALFFHAARVSPAWRLARIAQIDNHVFYR